MSAKPLLGSYHAGTSVLHRIDARVKLVCLLTMSVAILAVKNPLALVALGVAVLVCLRLSGAAPRELASALRPAAFLLAFGVISNMFAPAQAADVALGAVGISFAGLVRGVVVAARMVVLIALSLALCATTSSTAVADALGTLLLPLGRLGLPVDDVSMTLALALRFVPMAAEELARIHEAQLVRGANYSQGSVAVRVRRWCSALVPLVVGLFRRSDEIASAMRERGWGAGARTRLSRKLGVIDIMVLVICLAACLAAVLV